MKYCPGDEIYGMIVANPGFPGRNSGYPGPIFPAGIECHSYP